MTRKTTILLLFILTAVKCIGQTDNSYKQARSIFSNWVSLDYQNCLKKDLPCECEKSKEYFRISLETTKKFIWLYKGREHYEPNIYEFKIISQNNLEVYSEQYSQTLFKDTLTIIGQIIIKNDTLIFTDSLSKQTKFILYSIGDYNHYFEEQIKLLNAALTIRAYDNLNETLHSDSLLCYCNWELEDGLNIVFGGERNWIIEIKDTKLYIYEWINPPQEKTGELKISKKLIKKLKW